MRRLFFVFLLFTQILLAACHSFDCPYQCGKWGSESIREVEWQFLICLWELDRLSAFSIEKDFPYTKPQRLEDPWIQELKNGPLVIFSKVDECSERLYWFIEDKEEDASLYGKEFEWVFYTDFGSEDYAEDWDNFRIDSISSIFSALSTIRWHMPMMFYDRIDETYSVEISRSKARIEDYEQRLANNQKNLESLEASQIANLADNPSYSNSSNEHRIVSLHNTISKYQKDLEQEVARLAVLNAEYAIKMSAYAQYAPLVEKQMLTFKNSYTDIFYHCQKDHNAPNAYYELSRIHFLEGYYMDCLEDLQKLLEITSLELLSEKIDNDLVLQKGAIETKLGLFDAAIKTLSTHIKAHPDHKEAYFERALAYFEKGDFESSIADYLKSEKSISSYAGGWGLEFSAGLISGICSSAGDTMIDFVPSMLSSLNGLAHGLWAFACNPADVSMEMCRACSRMIDFLQDHSTLETLQVLIPEIKELTDPSKKLSFRRQGELIGSIIGRYGTDFLLYAGIGKGVKAFTDLRKANQLLTLEKMAKDATKWATLEEIHQSWWRKTKPIVDDIKQSSAARFEKLAKEFNKEGFSELQIRQILHHCGFKTFPRPKGIPHDCTVKFSKRKGGMVYVKAGTTETENILVRVMPGDPASPYPMQHKAYVVQRRGKDAVMPDGRLIDWREPEAHIPLESFEFNGW